MSKPMFFFTGVYETIAQAEQDYDAIKRLHDNKDIGSYDAAVLTKAMDDKVSVNKDEKPVKHGAYAGLAAGAGAAILFPPLLLVTAPAAIGVGVGAWMGHRAWHVAQGRQGDGRAASVRPGRPHRGGDRRGLGPSRAGHGRFAEPCDQASRGLGLRRGRERGHGVARSAAGSERVAGSVATVRAGDGIRVGASLAVGAEHEEPPPHAAIDLPTPAPDPPDRR